MLDSIFATKLDMTQAWSKQGKRLAVTRCNVADNLVVDKNAQNTFEIGYGQKKLKNMSKPLRSKMQKSGFLNGVIQLRGVKVQLNEAGEETVKVGDTITVGQVLEVGDIVKVQGTTKGRGFAGVMKRHGFKGGKRTHGQSDRLRAPGSIGSGTTPGRVWRGKRMAGHYGDATKTVTGLVVVYLDKENGDVWLNGPIPGFYSSTVRITKTGQKKVIELDYAASGIEIKPEKIQELENKTDAPQEGEAK